MPKLTRTFQKIFGDAVGAVGNFGIFGSLSAGTPIYSKDPTEIQSLAAFQQGLGGAVVGNKSPALEDINSLHLLTFYQIAYLLQQGLPEWNSQTTYYVNQFASSGGKIYKSKTNDNLGNAISNTNHWDPLIPAITLQKQLLLSDMVSLINTGSGVGSWTALDLQSQINAAGLNASGITVTGAILRLYSKLGPAGFAQYTGTCSMQAWGSNSATNTLSTSVIIRANDSDAAGSDSIYGTIPLPDAHTMYYRLLVTGTASGLNGQALLAGFTYNQVVSS